MPQASSTREKVFKAADSLLEQGVRPTQQSIRAQIGSGSLTTINKALNDWWQTLGERITRKNQHPDLPEPVLNIANQLWDRALAYAEHQFEEQKRALIERESALRAAISESEQGGQQALQELQNQNARLLDKCERLADERRELEQRQLKANDEIYRLTSRLDDVSRELKQQQRLGGAGEDGGEALVEARVRLRIQEEELVRLRGLNEQLTRENAMLKQKFERTS